jgi:hypothetical protein
VLAHYSDRSAATGGRCRRSVENGRRQDGDGEKEEGGMRASEERLRPHLDEIVPSL